MPVPLKVKGKNKSKALKKVASTFLQADEELFEKLRAFRRALADKAGIPPYVIFHDSVLIEMSAAKPKVLDDLRGIKGIGEHKLEKYGQLFLDAIAGRPMK
jgi:ATP-dependent DNA helicase RecQ